MSSSIVKLITIFIILIGLTIIDGFFLSDWYRRTSVFHENELCHNTSFGTHFAIIVHGWRENCEAKWIHTLTEKLEIFRGGCIMCMDYGLMAQIPHYFMLAKHINKLAWILKFKLEELEYRGFEPSEGYIFGFSLGGRIAIEAGRTFGHQRLGEIDTCDMAGPGFDFFSSTNSKEAALNVQCIHTSSDKGTKSRDCHQNWNMGNCGKRQAAASSPPYGSHGLCPQFYNAAFEHPFYAESTPRQCIKITKMKRFWPIKYRMGYMEPRKLEVRGTMYASTTDKYPYTPHARKHYRVPIRKRPDELLLLQQQHQHNITVNVSVNLTAVPPHPPPLLLHPSSTPIINHHIQYPTGIIIFLPRISPIKFS